MLICREQAYFGLEVIPTAIINHDEKLSPLPKSADRPATTDGLNPTMKAAEIGVEVIINGRIMAESLLRMGLNKRQLENRIKTRGPRMQKEIFLGIHRKEKDERRHRTQTSECAYDNTVLR